MEFNSWNWSGEGGKDLHCALRDAAACINPRSYLEIGVDGGDSLRVVLANTKPRPVRIVLCDMWQYEIHPYLKNHEHINLLWDEYHVDRERTKVTFVDGDSKITVPQIRETFDLITVDGDHSAEGARADLRNSWPLLNTGGVLAFDDIDHGTYPWLRGVFDEWFAGLDDAEIVPQTGPSATTVVVRRKQ